MPESSSGGIIATSFRWNYVLYDSVALLRTSDLWTDADETQFVAWTRAYLNWLLTSSHGKAEGRATNNHGTWLSVNIIAQALFIGDSDTAENVTSQLYSERASSLQEQILPSGQMPHETARADSVNYDAMNMLALTNLATLGSHQRSGANLWTWKNQTGYGSIRNALDYLMTYAAKGGPKWPYSQASDDFNAFCSLAPVLRRASQVYNGKCYSFFCLISFRLRACL